MKYQFETLSPDRTAPRSELWNKSESLSRQIHRERLRIDSSAEPRYKDVTSRWTAKKPCPRCGSKLRAQTYGEQYCIGLYWDGGTSKCFYSFRDKEREAIVTTKQAKPEVCTCINCGKEKARMRKAGRQLCQACLWFETVRNRELRKKYNIPKRYFVEKWMRENGHGDELLKMTMNVCKCKTARTLSKKIRAAINGEMK